MTLELIRNIQVIIIAFVSYTISITFAGWFESFVAQQVGDDTPEQAGFLTLNPLDHFNVFGFAAVLWCVFYRNLLPFMIIPGWGRFIPLLPQNIQGPHAKLRICIEFLARSAAHLILLMVVVLSGVACGFMNIHTIHPMIKIGATSFLEIIFALLQFMFTQNLLLFLFHFAIGVFRYLLHFYSFVLHNISLQSKILGFIILSLIFAILEPILITFVYQLMELIQAITLKIR